MGFSMLAAIVVMGFMTVFMVAAIRQISRLLSDSLKQEAVQMSGVYNEILEAKSLLLRELIEEVKEMEDFKGQLEEQPVAVKAKPAAETGCNPVSVLGKAAVTGWQEQGFADRLRALETSFCIDADATVNFVLERHPDTPLNSDNPAERLLLEISFDVFCQIAMLKPAMQYELLRTSLDQESAALLEDYRKDGKSGAAAQKFDAASFYSWLKNESRVRSRGLEVLASEKDSKDLACGNWPVKPVKGICKGVQIGLDGKIYDYSISERETG